MKKYILDKVLESGVLYRAESDKAYVINYVGTNSTTRAKLSVADAPCLEIVDVIAPLTTTNANLCGPMALGDCYIVVPPTKTIKFEGSAGSYMRIIGNIIELEPGETLPPELLSRYSAQSKKYLSYLEGSYSSAAAAAISANAEYDVIPTASVPVGERWTFASYYMGEVWTTAGSIPREQLATRIYINGKPLDIVEATMGKLGIYSTAAPHPPRADLNYDVFTFEEKPIVLEAGKDYRVTCVNNGPTKTLAAGETLEARVKWVFVKEQLT